ncbi:MAG: hypothetical protein Q9163_000696 [Psora crenata]
MRQQTHSTTQLPRKILEELGTSVQDYHIARKRKNDRGTRKEQRKAARVEKKTVHPSSKSPLVSTERQSLEYGKLRKIASFQHSSPGEAASAQPKGPKSILKKPAPGSLVVSTQDMPKPLLDSPGVSKQAKERFAEDDAEIEALERVLGVKATKKLPRSFEEDGLDTLLEGLDDIDSLTKAHLGKRKRVEEQDWLAKKRRTSQPVEEEPKEYSSDEFLGFEDIASQKDDCVTEDEAKEVTFHWGGQTDEFISGEEGDKEQSLITGTIRENPYVAPVTNSSDLTPSKYIPPSLRSTSEGGSGEISRLRRQLQGLLNRLSEANLLSIVNDVEEIYRLHARQHVSSTLIDMLITLLADPTSLHDTFLILHAGFIAALYKILGNDFGSQTLVRIDEEFNAHHGISQGGSVIGKRAINLMSLLAELYNFHVVGSSLIYDYIRICLKGLSEHNTELLLRVVRIAGQQLRQDDPSALKEIVMQLNASVAQLGENGLSVRTKFMLETINNLKNNRVKTGIAASSITSEHTLRMKKTLGSISQRSVRASEPLMIDLKDLRTSDRRGKWWLVGASFKDDRQQNSPRGAPNQHARDDDEEINRVPHNAPGDLAQLAKEQRMNTDVRRSIFIAVISATDYNDAYIRLMKLRLKKKQELEIPKVLIHCAGAEKGYNPFYTLLSRRVCTDRKLKMAFQFCLWDLFKQMGEEDGSVDENDHAKIENQPDLRSIVNLARMYGTLIAEGCLSLAVLKNLNLAYLQPRSRMFVELLLITTILQSQPPDEKRRNEAAVLDIFMKPKEMPQMASSLQFFLKKVVGKSDVAGSQRDRQIVKWGAKVAGDALSAILTQSTAEEM